jgi:hypothetical protein
MSGIAEMAVLHQLRQFDLRMKREERERRTGRIRRAVDAVKVAIESRPL